MTYDLPRTTYDKTTYGPQPRDLTTYNPPVPQTRGYMLTTLTDPNQPLHITPAQLSAITYGLYSTHRPTDLLEDNSNNTTPLPNTSLLYNLQTKPLTHNLQTNPPRPPAAYAL